MTYRLESLHIHYTLVKNLPDKKNARHSYYNKECVTQPVNIS